jgi:hypothetical protein
MNDLEQPQRRRVAARRRALLDVREELDRTSFSAAVGPDGYFEAVGDMLDAYRRNPP